MLRRLGIFRTIPTFLPKRLALPVARSAIASSVSVNHVHRRSFLSSSNQSQSRVHKAETEYHENPSNPQKLANLLNEYHREQKYGPAQKLLTDLMSTPASAEILQDRSVRDAHTRLYLATASPQEQQRVRLENSTFGHGSSSNATPSSTSSSSSSSSSSSNNNTFGSQESIRFGNPTTSQQSTSYFRSSAPPPPPPPQLIYYPLPPSYYGEGAGSSGSGSRGGIFSRILGFVPWLASAAFLVYLVMLLTGKGAAGGGPASLLKSNVKEVTADERVETRWNDVKGCDEAKNELEEVVKFLRNPDKFTRLGGKMPKGVLLVGPPGTGKTLLARAVAGEAGVPFFYCSGSEFEEMFVGLGARRIRDLFEAAKKKAPCLIFIDEIDAVGGKRSTREIMATRMTLNQLLVELDGFKPSSGVIVLAATNFPDALDPALLRPGRFDRHVDVPLPDLKGRKDILDLYLKKVLTSKDVDSTILARGTPGASGAELANLVNTAAVSASAKSLKQVTMRELEHAREKILMGAERRSAVMPAEVQRVTAYHEGGHAMMALYTDGALPLHKASIIPRGRALGVTHQLPEEKDIYNRTRRQLQADLDVLMGGRVAEELIFGANNVTTGASNDFQRANSIARQMVLQYGMSEKLGPITEDEKLSSKLREMADEEIKRIISESYARARNVLHERQNQLHRLAQALLRYETLSVEEIRRVINGEELSDRDAELAAAAQQK